MQTVSAQSWIPAYPKGLLRWSMWEWPKREFLNVCSRSCSDVFGKPAYQKKFSGIAFEHCEAEALARQCAEVLIKECRKVDDEEFVHTTIGHIRRNVRKIK